MYTTAEDRLNSSLLQQDTSHVLKEFDISLIIMKKTNVPPLMDSNMRNKLHLPITNPDAQSQSSLSLGIDFTFNTIKNVKKVAWKEDAPWYREISDGFCWLCFCQNNNC